jgi:hypothetical protein
MVMVVTSGISLTSPPLLNTCTLDRHCSCTVLNGGHQFSGGLYVEAVPGDFAFQFVDAIWQFDKTDHAQALEVAHYGFEGAQVDFFTFAEEAGAIQVEVGVGDAVCAKACHL